MAWEAIVVDDGSTDATAAMVERLAEADPRIRLIRQPGRGVSAARNAGLAAARSEWVSFLDADDWLAPGGLRSLLRRAEETPEADVVVGVATRVSCEGRPWSYPGRDLSDPFGVLATHCAFPIHSTITRRSRVLALGGFDEDLPSSEDWDLWQRLARAGCRFAQTPAHVAVYRARLGSLSRKLPQAAEQGLRVMRRAHGPDPRVPAPDPRYAQGAPAHALPAHELYFVLWAAARDIADGGDGRATAGLLPPDLDVDFEPASLGELLAGGMADMLACRPEELASRWPQLEPKLRAVFEQVYPGDARARLKALALGAIKARCHGAKAEDADVLQLGTSTPPPDLDGAQDFTVLQVRRGSCTVGMAALPRLGALGVGDLKAAVLEQARQWPLKAALTAARPWRRAAFWSAAARAGLDLRGLGLKTQRRDRSALRRIIAQRTRHALSVGLQAALARDLKALPDDPGPSDHATRRAKLAEEASAVPLPDVRRASTGQSRTAGGRADRPESAQSWDAFFTAEDPWNYGGSEYERVKYEDTLELIPPLPDGSALELACAEGHFTPRLAGKVGTLLATDISTTALRRAQARSGQCPNVVFQQLDFMSQPLPATYDLIVCSEVLYYAGERLREVAAKLAGALRPGGLLVMAHANLIADEPEATGFDWGHSYGARTIGESLAATPGLMLEREIRRPLYRVQRFRKLAEQASACAPTVEIRPLQVRLEPAVARNVVWGGGESRIFAFRRESAVSIPVLMYHRVSPDPAPPGLEAFCVAPEIFAQQIGWLRRRGYWGVTPEELTAALTLNRPLPGRPVMITFDDGYADFAVHAAPVLEKHDLAATLFAPAGKVGGSADWDAAHGPAAPLLDWTELVELSRRQVTIESHGFSHRALTRLGVAETYRELLRSREMIAQATGRAPISICYPYGAVDPVVARAASECGYQLGFSTAPGVASLADDRFRLPRLEMTSKDDPETFARRLGRASAGSGRSA